MTEREKLINSLWAIGILNANKDSLYKTIADFILTDRKRILEPLLNNVHDTYAKKIYQTIKNAGL